MSTLVCIKNYSIKTVILSIVFVYCFLNSSTSFARLGESQSNPLTPDVNCAGLFSNNGSVVEKSINFPAIGTDVVSSSISYVEEGSTKFEKKIKPIADLVEDIYGYRKIDVAGEAFLNKWLDDVRKHQYDSYIVKVLSGETMSGTLRIATPDKKRKGLLPLENFLGIKLQDFNPDRYEIGLLTINRGLSIEEKYRVHLELWLNLVRFFKERGQKTVKIYAFSDVFGTRLYTKWKFAIVKSYIKDGKVLSMDENEAEYMKGLLVGKNQITILEYDLSRDNLAELLELFTRGRFDLNSDIVINRLKDLQLYDVFEPEQPVDLIIENSPEEGSWLGHAANI